MGIAILSSKEPSPYDKIFDQMRAHAMKTAKMNEAINKEKKKQQDAKKPAPYSVGVTELDKAQKAMKELNKLKVNQETYEDAVDSRHRHNWNWITGDDAQRGKIEKQTKLEKEVSKNLSKIAAANVHNPDAVSPETMKAARGLQTQLHDRLVLDGKLAAKADGDDDETSPYEKAADEAYSKSSDLQRVLSETKPDAIPLDKTQSFLDQLTKLEVKIEGVKSDYEVAKSEKNGTDTRKARQEMEKLGKELKKMHDQRGDQVGSNRVYLGNADYKMQALPDGDALKTAYAKQDKALDNEDVISRIHKSGDNVAEIVKYYNLM